MIISNDAGRSSVKAASSYKQILFPSDIGEYRTLNLRDSFGPEEIVVEYEGTKYFVGKLAQEESEYPVRMFTKSKANFETKLLTMTAIAKLFNDDRVQLVTSVPINMHTPKEKKAIKDLLLGKHSICLNGVWKNFTITDVEVGAEGGLAHWSVDNPPAGLQRYIDFGSATLNVATLKDGKYISRDSFTEDLGVEFKRNFNADRMTSTVISLLSRLNKPDGMTLIGGAAGTFCDSLNKEFGNVTIHPKAIMANAIGGLNAGRVIWQ